MIRRQSAAKKWLLITFAIGVICASGWWYFIYSIEKPDIELSAQSQRTLIEIEYQNAIDILSGIPAEQRSRIQSFEDIIASGSVSAGNSVSFERIGFRDGTRQGHKYDYLVFANRAGIPSGEAILIATSCPITSVQNPSKSLRIALTHDLRIVELEEKEFHSIVFRQSILSSKH
jgi:hypothetical protein